MSAMRVPAEEDSLEIAVPAFDEAARLERGFRLLRAWLDGNGFRGAKICIAENGSRDATPRIADALAAEFSETTRAIHLPRASLADALRAAWASSDAALLGYCDADMATAPEHVAEAVALLRERPRLRLVSGSRRLPASVVSGRAPGRRALSRIYAFCVNLALGTRFTDSACGFKFLRRAWFEEIAGTLVAEDYALGAELALLAERAGALAEIPVRWEERAGTHVRVLPTIFSSAASVLKIRRAHAKNPTPRAF